LLDVLARAYTDLSASYAYRKAKGDATAAFAHRRTALELHCRLGDIPTALGDLVTLVGAYGLAGRIQKAPALVMEVLETVGVPAQMASECRLIVAHWLFYCSGEWEQALELSRRRATEARQRGDPPAVVVENEWIARLGADLVEFGAQRSALGAPGTIAHPALTEAAAAMRELLTIVEKRPTLGACLPYVLRLAQVEALRVHLAAARRLLAQGERLLDEDTSPGLIIHSWRDRRDVAAYCLARAEGRWRDAAALAQRHVNQEWQSGWRWNQARWLTRLGDARRGRDGPGDQQRAREAYNEALALFTDTGADGYVEGVKQRLATLQAAAM
jgi:hypothetical protein